MPQMAPISWLLLFIIFFITFIIFNMMNYYSYPMSIMSSSTDKKFHKTMNWKW